MSVREEKREWTRAALELAALELFEEKGFEETTIAEIAAAADVSPRTVFRYFPAKLDLVFGFTSRAADHFVGLLAARPADERAYTALRAALLDFASSLDRPDLARRSALLAKSPALNRRSLEIRESWVMAAASELARRCGKPDPPPALYVAASSAEAIIVIAVRTWRTRGAPEGDLREVTREVLDSVPQFA